MSERLSVEYFMIHPTAIIDPKAHVDPDVEIGPYCVIGADVRIGSGTRLLDHVSIMGPTTVGRDNVIYPFSVIGADPQDLKFRGEEAQCIIGDGNHIREHVTIHRGTHVGGGVTRIGDENLIMVAAHVAHDCIVGSHCVIANQVMVGGHAVIEDGASIGGGAGIHHFATVGTMSFVAGLCRVKRDVPPYMKVEGDPMEVRGVNTIALTRRHVSDDEVGALKEAYKRLFLHRRNGRSGRSTTASENGATVVETKPETPPTAINERIGQLLDEFNDRSLVVELCNSLRRSANGVHGRSREVQREDSKYQTPAK